MVATSCLVFVSGQITATIEGYGTPQVGGYIGISNIILLSTFIYATAPASGGHLNPMITFSAILTGLCSVPRGMHVSLWAVPVCYVKTVDGWSCLMTYSN